MFVKSFFGASCGSFDYASPKSLYALYLRSIIILLIYILYLTFAVDVVYLQYATRTKQSN